MKKVNFKNQLGFTLIELLVVIVIIGVLAAGLLALIDPIGKIKQAEDAGIKDAIAQMAAGEQSYYSTTVSGGSGHYAGTGGGTDAFSALQTAGEIKATSTLPATFPSGNYAVTIKCNGTGGACTAAANPTEFALYSSLQHPGTAGYVWCYQSRLGKATETTAALCVP